MMAFTTLIIAVPIVAILYFFVFKKIKQPFINYLIVIVVGGLFFFGRNLHLIYIGLEVIIIGVVTVFVQEKFSKKKNNSKT